jgi:hypothetical protein
VKFKRAGEAIPINQSLGASGTRANDEEMN